LLLQAVFVLKTVLLASRLGIAVNQILDFFDLQERFVDVAVMFEVKLAPILAFVDLG